MSVCVTLEVMCECVCVCVFTANTMLLLSLCNMSNISDGTPEVETPHTRTAGETDRKQQDWHQKERRKGTATGSMKSQKTEK